MLRHPAITLGVLIATIAATGFLFITVPKGFFPEQDNGTVFGGMQGSQDASFQAMQGAALQVSNTIKSDPAVAAVVSFVGGTNGATNSGFVYVALKPLSERKISSSGVINRLRPKLAGVPGAMTFLQAGQDLRIGGRQSNAQYQYTIQSENLQDLVKWGPVVLAEMRKLHGFTDVNSDQQNAGLQASLTYDRQTAARLGISAQLIDDTLYDAFGQRQVSTMLTSLNQYHVVMEVDPQFWQSPTGLDAIYIRPNTTASSAGASPSPIPTGGGTSSALSVSPSAPVPIPSPSVASPFPTDGPITAPTPPSPFPGFVPLPTPAVVAMPTATPSTAVAGSQSTSVSGNATMLLSTTLTSTAAGASLSTAPGSQSTPTLSPTTTSSATVASSTPVPIAVAMPSTTPGTIQLLPTTTPTPLPSSAIATLAAAASSSAAASSTPASNAIATAAVAGSSSQPTPSPTPVVPLSAIANYQPTTAPIAVNHQGQFPSVTISFNLAGGMALSDAVRVIQQMQQRVRMPSTVHGSFSGAAQAFQASLASEPFLILAALVAVYIVLGILYESYIHPITILSTLPSAGVGALLALMICHTELSVIGIIGILLLIGIVKKNAILMVDFALEAERAEGMRPREAIYQACLLRFRPILMTTVAALFGALPLVISNGVGSELRRPLGITIVGGLIFSQALTLYTTPVVYLYFDRLREWWASRKQQTLVSPHATLGVPDAI